MSQSDGSRGSRHLNIVPLSGLENEATVAGGDAATSNARDGQQVLRAAGDAIRAEGSAQDESARHGLPTHLTITLFSPKEGPRAITLEDVPHAIARDDNLVWIDLSHYRTEDLRPIAELLDIHPTLVELMIASWTRPRLNVFRNHFLASVTVADLDSSRRRVQAQQLDLVIGRNILLSAHKHELPFAERILMRASQAGDLVTLESAYLLYIILDQLMEYYEVLEETMQADIESIEERALQDSSDEFLEDLLHFKRYNFALSQLIQQHRSIFTALLRPDFPFVSGDEVQSYFYQLESRLSAFVDRLTASQQEVNGAFDIYVSHQSHRTNHQMKILTMVATVLLPATFIVGFFGTTFPSIPMNTTPAFVIMVLLIVGISGGLIATFHRQDWI